jgi:DNA ligase-1
MSRHEAARARQRFADVEAKGRDPWKATATRINRTGKPAKIAGTAMFLRELAVERPHERKNIARLLGLMGLELDGPYQGQAGSPLSDEDVIDAGTYQGQTRSRRKPKPAANPFMDWCAAVDAAAPATTPSGSQTPVPAVLLAKKYKAQDPSCYWMSEKLDGVRAIWDGTTFWSRAGNEFNAPAWFREGMPRNTVLDGELFAGRGLFRDTISAVRRKIPNDKQWKQIRYLAFDVPLVPGTFEQRMAELNTVVARAPKKSHLEVVVQKVCGGQRALDAFHRQLEAKGGEGVMLRLKGSPYEHKRSSTLLKVKNFIDDEARIIGYQDGAGKHTGVLGAYHAELLSSGARFRVGTGLTDKHRRNPHKLGTVITVRYFELTPDGKPRFPVYIAARDYE